MSFSPTRTLYAIIATALVLFAFGSACAQKLPSPNAQDPYRLLQHARFFAIGGVGFAGTKSDGEQGLRRLLKRKEASRLFGRLLDEATDAGKLYALLGLKLTDPQAFKRVVTRYDKMQTKVDTMSGCLMQTRPISDVVAEIVSGKYR